MCPEMQHARKRESEKARKAQGVMARDKNAMRVFIPVTPVISKVAKYYVGVKEAAGRLFARVIAGDNIFFYAESWHGLQDDESKRPVKLYVNNRIVYILKCDLRLLIGALGSLL